jgi:hypothetical protein
VISYVEKNSGVFQRNKKRRKLPNFIIFISRSGRSLSGIFKQYFYRLTHSKYALLKRKNENVPAFNCFKRTIELS